MKAASGLLCLSFLVGVAGCGNKDVTSSQEALRSSKTGPSAQPAGNNPSFLMVNVSPTTAVSGQPVTISATLSNFIIVIGGPAPTPTGTITFTSGASTLGTVNVVGDGTYTLTPNPTFLVGSYNIAATYSGDGTFSSTTATPVPLTVNQASTTTSVTSSKNPSLTTDTVTFTATVAVTSPGAGTVSGTVSFSDGTTTYCSVTLSSTTATCVVNGFASGGTRTITATYSGNTELAGSSGTVQQNVGAPTTVTGSSMPSSSTYGDNVTFTFSVASGTNGATPTGTVEVTDGTTDLGTITLTNGTGTLTTNAVAVGTRSIVGTYSGDGTYAGGTTATVTQTVSKAATTTSISTTNNSPTVGQQVTLSASVTQTPTQTPTGTVKFFDGTTLIGSGTLDTTGDTSVNVSFSTSGTHSITAVYQGDGTYNGSTSSPLSENVAAANSTTTLASSANPSSFGQTVTFTATVAPSSSSVTITPTGTVQFFSDGVSIGTGTLSNGTATVATSALTQGTHTITATYSGDGSFNGSSTLLGLLQVVGAPSTSVALTSSSTNDTSQKGDSVTFTATVTGSESAVKPTGKVTFNVDGVDVTPSVTLTNGVATFTTSGLGIGTHTITATYGGDTTYAGGTSAQLVQTVTKDTTTTTVTSSSNPSMLGHSVTFTVTVSSSASGTPSGNYTISIDGTAVQTAALTNGSATFATSSLTVGTHAVTASYAGDATFASSSTTAALSQEVDKDATTTTLSSSSNPSMPGAMVVITATVASTTAGTPTGTVTFTSGSTTLGTSNVDSNGHATLTMSFTTNTPIVATYSGDSSYAGSTSPSLTQATMTTAATITMTSNPMPSTYGQLVQVFVTVGGATGTVTLKVDGTTYGTQTLSFLSQAAFDVTDFTVGSHTFAASYSGDPATSPGMATLMQTVTKAPTTSFIESSKNPSGDGEAITLTAIVNSPIDGFTGTVAFFDGSTMIGTAPLNGIRAFLSTSGLSVGTHMLTAAYQGDTNFAGSTSHALAQVVQGALGGNNDMAVTPDAGPLEISGGGGKGCDMGGSSTTTSGAMLLLVAGAYLLLRRRRA